MIAAGFHCPPIGIAVAGGAGLRARIGEAWHKVKILLHLGAHRTATTTFQSGLERSAAGLADLGLAVWTPKRTRSGLLSGLIHRPEDVTEQIERQGHRATGVIRIELERLARSGMRQVLISEENVIGAARNNLRQERLYPLVDERLLRFRRAFDGHALRIGLSVRSYDTYWASCYAFAVARGHRLPGPGMLDRLVTQPRRWIDVIHDIARGLPGAEIMVWPFERFAGRPGDVLADLTGGLYTNRPGAWDLDALNPGPHLPQLRRILRDRGEAEAARHLPDGDGRWMPFDSGQARALREQYREDLAWLMAGADGLARFPSRPAEAVAEGYPVFATRRGDTGKMTDEEIMEAARWDPPDKRGPGHGKQEVVV